MWEDLESSSNQERCRKKRGRDGASMIKKKKKIKERIAERKKMKKVVEGKAKSKWR